MSRRLLKRKYNAWVIYWPPGETGLDGLAELGTPELRQANWKEGSTRNNLTSTGEEFTVSDSVLFIDPVEEGGFLMRITEVEWDAAESEVQARIDDDLAGKYGSPSPESRIRKITSHNSPRRRNDPIYTALL